MYLLYCAEMVFCSKTFLSIALCGLVYIAKWHQCIYTRMLSLRLCLSLPPSPFLSDLQTCTLPYSLRTFPVSAQMFLLFQLSLWGNTGMQLMSSSCLCLETSPVNPHDFLSPVQPVVLWATLNASKIIPGFSNHFCHCLAFLPPDLWSSVRPCRWATYAVINNLSQALTSSAHCPAAFCSVSASALPRNPPLKLRSFPNCIKYSNELGALCFFICGSCSTGGGGEKYPFWSLSRVCGRASEY